MIIGGSVAWRLAEYLPPHPGIGSVDTDDPDPVVVLLACWELMDRRLNGRYQHVGEPEFGEYLRAELRQALAVTEYRGARVPC